MVGWEFGGEKWALTTILRYLFFTSRPEGEKRKDEENEKRASKLVEKAAESSQLFCSLASFNSSCIKKKRFRLWVCDLIKLTKHNEIAGTKQGGMCEQRVRRVEVPESSCRPVTAGLSASGTSWFLSFCL